MKVRINATGDTIVMKFVRPSPDVKLEGYILGYGSSMFSKQFIQLPENGKPYETEMGKIQLVVLCSALERQEAGPGSEQERCQQNFTLRSPQTSELVGNCEIVGKNLNVRSFGEQEVPAAGGSDPSSEAAPRIFIPDKKTGKVEMGG